MEDRLNLSIKSPPERRKKTKEKGKGMGRDLLNPLSIGKRKKNFPERKRILTRRLKDLRGGGRKKMSLT